MANWKPEGAADGDGDVNDYDNKDDYTNHDDKYND